MEVLKKNRAKLNRLNPQFREFVERFLIYTFNKYNISLTITSGYRTPEENRKAGGVPNSAHLKGLAIDVAFTQPREKYYIIRSAIEFGFKRIGIGSGHIHLDMDLSKPYPVIFCECH